MAFAHVQTKPTKESAKICKNIKIETNLRLLSFHDVACLHHVGPFGKIVKIWNSGLPGRSSSKISWTIGANKPRPFRGRFCSHYFDPKMFWWTRLKSFSQLHEEICGRRSCSLSHDLWHLASAGNHTVSHDICGIIEVLISTQTKGLGKLNVNVKKLIKGIWEKALMALLIFTIE